jgi:hypothetical protein
MACVDKPTRDDRDSVHEFPQRNNRRDKARPSVSGMRRCVSGSKAESSARRREFAVRRSLLWQARHRGCCPGSFSGSKKGRRLPISGWTRSLTRTGPRLMRQAIQSQTRCVDAQSLFSADGTACLTHQALHHFARRESPQGLAPLHPHRFIWILAARDAATGRCERRIGGSRFLRVHSADKQIRLRCVCYAACPACAQKTIASTNDEATAAMQ